MSSIKKRFKKILQDIERSAEDLELICVNMDLLEPMSALTFRVLQCCSALKLRAATLNKEDFVEQISQDENLIGLDDLADEDVISILEGDFAVAWTDCKEDAPVQFMGQLLEKLERRHVNMLKAIRRLGPILEESKP